MNAARVLMIGSVLVARTALGADGPSDPKTFTINLGPRSACATPKTVRQARAEGGATEVVTPSSNLLSVTMSGSVAANAILGHTSSATETFHLEQELEITCSDPAAKTVKLTMESALVGFVRAKHKACSGMKLASARLCVPGSSETPLVMVHPAMTVDGDDAHLCNQHLPVIKVDQMPLGHYILVADFVLSSDAGGLLDGHSAADFSPTTSLPADWIRARDPFQGVDKKDFGFKIVVTAEAADHHPSVASRPQPPLDSRLIPTKATTTLPPLPARPASTTTAKPRALVTGLDRHSGPH